MKRREFIAGLGGAVAWPVVASSLSWPNVAIMVAFRPSDISIVRVLLL